jgi:16S rRNA (guanine527-N7)-methyltransferase
MKDETCEFRPALEAALSSFGIEGLTAAQINQLVEHYSMLAKWNERVNLTRIIEPRDAAELHYAESLFGGRFIGDARSLLDIGSGAGFPVIPLAVLRPDIQITALEANTRKSLFLNEAKDALALNNFRVQTARLEAIDWSSYDLMTSRALDRALNLLPSVVERLGRRQRLMLYCAPDLAAKLKNCARAGRRIETHAIPQSKSRIIAIFSAD